MTGQPRLVVIGSINVDLVAFADRIPDAGETLAGSAFLQGFGGKGANQAVMAARFDLDVSMVGAVGKDPNGQAAVENLRAAAVGIDDIATAGSTTGVASIWVDGSGANRIVIVAGANAAIDAMTAAAAVRRCAPAVVVGQFEIPQAVTAAAFAAAREVGAVTILNPAPGAPIEPTLLAASDWLVPNETELPRIGGPELTGPDGADASAIESWARGAARGAIVTLGDRGAVIVPPDGALDWIRPPEVRTVDTTGAGDAFVGAFAAGLALGLEPRRAARLGAALAADSVTRPGTQASFADAGFAARTLESLRQP